MAVRSGESEMTLMPPAPSSATSTGKAEPRPARRISSVNDRCKLWTAGSIAVVVGCLDAVAGAAGAATDCKKLSPPAAAREARASVGKASGNPKASGDMVASQSGEKNVRIERHRRLEPPNSTQSLQSFALLRCMAVGCARYNAAMKMSDRVRLALVTGGGVGLIPLAPGTWGTVVGVLLFLPTLVLSEPWQTLVLGSLILMVCVITVALGEWTEVFLGKKDPQCVVLDEIAGILVTLTLFRGVWPLWLTLLSGFALFRVLDIVKLAPARQAEKLPKGWGVLIDDLISGCYAAAMLWAAWSVTPRLL